MRIIKLTNTPTPHSFAHPPNSLKYLSSNAYAPATPAGTGPPGPPEYPDDEAALLISISTGCAIVSITRIPITGSRIRGSSAAVALAGGEEPGVGGLLGT